MNEPEEDSNAELKLTWFDKLSLERQVVLMFVAVMIASLGISYVTISFLGWRL